jgi:hypothetical protein
MQVEEYNTFQEDLIKALFFFVALIILKCVYTDDYNPRVILWDFSTALLAYLVTMTTLIYIYT